MSNSSSVRISGGRGRRAAVALQASQRLAPRQGRLRGVPVDGDAASCGRRWSSRRSRLTQARLRSAHARRAGPRWPPASPRSRGRAVPKRAQAPSRNTSPSCGHRSSAGSAAPRRRRAHVQQEERDPRCPCPGSVRAAGSRTRSGTRVRRRSWSRRSHSGRRRPPPRWSGSWVRAGTGLGEQLTPQQLAGERRRKESPALLLGAGAEDGLARQHQALQVEVGRDLGPRTPPSRPRCGRGRPRRRRRPASAGPPTGARQVPLPCRRSCRAGGRMAP